MTRNLKFRADRSKSKININEIKGLSIAISPSTHILSGIGRMFPNLNHLSFRDSTIQFVERSDLANMKNLGSLILEKCLIEFFPEDFLADLPNLTSILISYSKIEKVPEKFFMNQRKLTSLSFHDHSLRVLDKDLFKNNLKLDSIYLFRNDLEEINVDFTVLPVVNYIDLRWNRCIDDYWYPSRESIQAFQEKVNRNCTRK